MQQTSDLTHQPGEIHYETAQVISQAELTPGIKDLRLSLSRDLIEGAKPGQFISLYCRDQSRLLPRPISICDVDRDRNALRLVYRVVGNGTAELSARTAWETMQVMGPLGNGYDLAQAAGKRVLVVGGGLGVPPMLYLSKCLTAGEGQASVAPVSVTAVMGYRDEKTVFLDDDFRTRVPVVFASDDGSLGIRGTVVDAIRREDLAFDVLFACGPLPMLRALAALSEEYRRDGKDNKCYVSLEERMACGIGACLGCITQTTEEDAHSHVHNARICAEGPVFDSREIAWGTAR